MLRPETVEMSVWGVAGLAGLEAGGWRSVEEVGALRGHGQEFRRSEAGGQEEFRRWQEACTRFCQWNSLDSL